MIFRRISASCIGYRDKDPELIGSMYNLLLWEKGFIAGSVADMRRQIEASGDAESLKLLGELTEKRTRDCGAAECAAAGSRCLAEADRSVARRGR